MSEYRDKLLLRRYSDDDIIHIITDDNYDNFIKFDSLKIILEGITKLKEDTSLMWLEIDKINSKISDVTEIYKDKELEFKVLSRIMFELIDYGLKNNEIIKIGYNISKEYAFYIVLTKCDFISINKISNLEIEIIRKYPNLDIELEPISIDEDINDNIKYFYITDYRE